MMVREKFVQLRRNFIFGFIFLWAACASPSPSASVLPATVDIRLGDAKVLLSSLEAVDGSLLRVVVDSPEVPAATLVGEFEGTKFPLHFDKQLNCYEGLFGVPYGTKPSTYPFVLEQEVAGKKVRTQTNILVKDGGYLSEQLSADPKKVHPSKKALAKIMKEKVEIGKTYSEVINEKLWAGPFQFPMSSAITSNFGNKRIFNGDFNSFHTGMDFRAAVGSKVYAPAAGKVVWTKNLFYTGNTVMINHGYGLITIYAHLSKVKVKKGQMVKTGQLLGLSGKTGRVSGPHLHWQVVVNKVKVNPLDLTKVLK